MNLIYEPEINFWLSQQKIRRETLEIYNDNNIDEYLKDLLAEYGFCYGGKLANKLHCYACLRVLHIVHDRGIVMLHNSWCPYYNHYNPYPSKKISSAADFNLERERLCSFVEWPLITVEPSVLARNGFIFLKKLDYCECFDCSIIIGMWELNSTKYKDHLPNCNFNNRTSIRNINLYQSYILEKLSLPHEEWPPFLDSEPKSKLIQCKNIYRDVKCCDSILHAVVNLQYTQGVYFYEIQYKGYEHLQKRMDSFVMEYRQLWPLIRGNYRHLARAGFFYLGKSDFVACFRCGGVLTNWREGDDPFVEHARWYPYCIFIYVTKGLQFIRKVHNENPPMLKVHSTGIIKTANILSRRIDYSVIEYDDFKQFINEVSMSTIIHVFDIKEYESAYLAFKYNLRKTGGRFYQKIENFKKDQCYFAHIHEILQIQQKVDQLEQETNQIEYFFQ